MTPRSIASVASSSYPSEVDTQVPEHLRGYDRPQWQGVDPYATCEDGVCSHDTVYALTLDELLYGQEE